MGTVADLLVAALGRMGVPRAFTAGEADRPMRRAAERVGLPVVTARSETAAVVMASVTADLAGVPGVVLLDDRAAVPTLLSALAQARADRSPLIVVTDAAGSSAPPAGIAEVTKASLPMTVESAARWIAHAAHLAMSSPCGPVHLALPSDVALASAPPVATAVAPAALPPAASELDHAARLIAQSARPVIAAGRETRSLAVAEWLRALAEALPAPVIATPKARGVIPEPHPLALGVLGAGGVARTLLARADLIVAVGLDPIELDAQASDWRAPVLHLARARAEGTPYVPVHEITGDIALVIEELAPRLRDRKVADWDVAELDRLKRALGTERTGTGPELDTRRVVAAAREATPAGAIAAFDPGVQAAALTWLCVSPLDLFVPHPPGIAGFAVPAAIAARIARPDRLALAFTDAAGFAAALAELETAARADAAIVVLVANDTSRPMAPVGPATGARTLGAESEAELFAAIARALAATEAPPASRGRAPQAPAPRAPAPRAPVVVIDARVGRAYGEEGTRDR